VQVGVVEACKWGCSSLLAQRSRQDCEGSGVPCDVGGGRGGEEVGQVEFLRVLMRRVLGSLSLACGPCPVVPASSAPHEVGCLTSDPVSGSSAHRVRVPQPAASVVWRAGPDGARAAADAAVDTVSGGGGLLRLHKGMWVRVELLLAPGAPCLRITVAREAAAGDAEESAGMGDGGCGSGAMSEGESEDPDGGEGERGWEVLVEMQRVADDIACSLLPGSGRLVWRGCE